MGDLKFQIQHYATEMWRRKWSILLVGLLVGLMGTYIAASRPDVFTSRAAVEVDENALLNAVLPRGVPRTNTSAAIDSVRRGIYARPNLEQIIYDTDLNLTLNDRRGMEALVENLENKLELKRQGTNYYVIEYTNNDPIVARDVTQAALDIFLERSGGSRNNSGPDGEDVNKYLQDKLDVANGKLETIQAEIAEYQRVYDEEIRGTSALQNQLRGLESQLSSLRSDRLLYQGEISNLQSRLATTPREIVVDRVEQIQQQRQQTPRPRRPNVVVPQNGPTPEQNRADAYQRQLGALQGELSTMLERLTPQHPDVVTMQNRLNAAQGEFSQLQAAAQASNGRQQAEASRARQLLADYDRAIDQWTYVNSQPLPQLPKREIFGPNPLVVELTSQINNRGSRLNVINSEISTLNTEIRKVNDVMARQPEIVQRFSKLNTAEAKLLNEVSGLENQIEVIQPASIGTFRMKVVEPPIAPVTPAGPNRLLLFMGAFLLASGSGLGLAFVRVQLADNIPTIKHLKNNFDLPILGGVSKMEAQSDIAKKAAGNLVFLASIAALIAIFGYVTYRYHFELWRPDFAGLLAKFGIAPTAGG